MHNTNPNTHSHPSPSLPRALRLLVGLAYPLLGALKAIKVQEAHVIKFFIQYFLLFNALNLLETFLPLSRLPLYYLGKLLFLAWAFNPKTQGARLVYGTLRPLLLPHLGIALGASGAEQSRPGGGGRKRGGGRENTGEGRFGARDGSGEGASIHLRIEIAARGLEKPAEPERLDTLCQLRILPMTGGHSEVRRAALDEGQWYKSRINTAPPQDAPDWRHDPQFLRVPTTEDNVLEVLIVNKMSWRDHPLGRVRLPLRGLSFPIETTLPLEDPFGDEREEGGEENERGEVQGELEIHLARVEE